MIRTRRAASAQTLRDKGPKGCCRLTNDLGCPRQHGITKKSGDVHLFHIVPVPIQSQMAQEIQVVGKG